MTFADWLIIFLLGSNVIGCMLMHYYRAMARFHRRNADRGWTHFADAMDCLRVQRDLMAEMEERDSGEEWKDQS